MRVTDRQVRPNVQSEESLSFGVSEAYELRRGAGGPGGRGQGTEAQQTSGRVIQTNRRAGS